MTKLAISGMIFNDSPLFFKELQERRCFMTARMKAPQGKTEKLNLEDPLSIFLHYTYDLYIVLSSNLVILDLNPAVLNFYGKTNNPNCYKGKRYSEILGTDHKLCELISNLKFSSKFSDSKIIELSTVVNKKSIQWKIILTSNPKGMIVVLVGRDLSSEIAAEQKGRDASFSLETMIAHLPGNVYWMDKNCIHLGCNNNVLKMLGLTREQYVGKTYEELAEIAGWKKGEAESFKRDDLEVLRTGIPKFNVEEPPLRHVDGKVLYYLTTRVPMRNEAGEIVGVAGISIDISDRKLVETKLKEAKEKAEEAAEAKSQFLANITHDFITPLSIIIGGVDALMAQGDDALKRLEYCDDIKDTANSLLNDVQDILEVARFNHKELPIKYEAFNIQELALEIKRAFTLQASNKNIKINVEYPKEFNCNIISDKHRIRRILNNLLANAIKFTENGEVTLKFSISKNQTETPYLNFSVTDMGIGIPKNKLNEIFEPFIRLKPSYFGHHKGVGLGLSNVREFVEQLAGKIFVKSKLGIGTTFYCKIPCDLPEFADNNSPNKQIKKNFNRNSKILVKQKNLKILLVEDEPIIQKFTKIILSNLGCQVTVAQNAKEAIQLALSNEFDLILLDLGLPDYDGSYVTKAIRAQELEKNCKPNRIVALTAHVDEKQKQECLKKGMNKFCKKPLTEEKFLRMCKELTLF